MNKYDIQNDTISLVFSLGLKMLCFLSFEFILLSLKQSCRHPSASFKLCVYKFDQLDIVTEYYFFSFFFILHSSFLPPKDKFFLI